TLARTYEVVFHLRMQDFDPLTPQAWRPEEPEVAQWVSYDSSESVVLGFPGPFGSDDVNVKLRGLDSAASYSVRDQLSGVMETQSGYHLQKEGITLNLTSGAAMRLVRRVTQ
nr:hypothetical protein [Dehalococcoidales bacterium]